MLSGISASGISTNFNKLVIYVRPISLIICLILSEIEFSWSYWHFKKYRYNVPLKHVYVLQIKKQVSLHLNFLFLHIYKKLALSLFMIGERNCIESQYIKPSFRSQIPIKFREIFSTNMLIKVEVLIRNFEMWISTILKLPFLFILTFCT